jgi:methionyl-tRNA synthetase
MATYDDFTKLEFKVGKIVEVQIHPNADKLYVLKVDTGDKVAQIVAGIRASYTVEELQDKLVAILTNLEPREIRGVTSEGMLLAAKSDTDTVILTAQRAIAQGSIIK